MLVKLLCDVYRNYTSLTNTCRIGDENAWFMERSVYTHARRSVYMFTCAITGEIRFAVMCILRRRPRDSSNARTGGGKVFRNPPTEHQTNRHAHNVIHYVFAFNIYVNRYISIYIYIYKINIILINTSCLYIIKYNINIFIYIIICCCINIYFRYV